MSPPTRMKKRLVDKTSLMTRFQLVVAIAVCLSSTLAFAQESLFDTEARKSTIGRTKSSDIGIPARVEGPAFHDLTSSASGAAARSEELAVFSVRDGRGRDVRNRNKESRSLFDQAAGSSSLIATKTFPFVSDVDKDERVEKLIEETAPAAANVNRLLNRRRLAAASDRKSFFDAQNNRQPLHREDEQNLPPPRNFDIITFGNNKDGRNDDDSNNNSNRAYSAEQEADSKRRKAEETLKELEERIRLEERLAAARRFRDAQRKQDELRQRELEATSEDRRYTDEDREGGEILLRLTQRDGELYPSPSSSYDDSPPVYNQYQPQEEIAPQARSYNVYQPQGPPQPPPYKPGPLPAAGDSSYESPQLPVGDVTAGYYGRQPAVIASNSPQGPVIHITLNQHLPTGERPGGGEEQGDSSTRPPTQASPPAGPPLPETPAGPARPPSPPSPPPQAAPPSPPGPQQSYGNFASSPFFNSPPQPFFNSPPQPFFSAPTNFQFVPAQVAIPVPQQAPPVQQSPPAQAAPPAQTTPAPAQQPQPIIVVVEKGKGGGYGSSRGYGSDDHSGVGVRVVKGSFDNQQDDNYGSRNNNNNDKARSLSYTIRIPSDQKDNYGREPRRSSYQQRPTTYISRSNRGSDIYTAGSKPKEIFLDIGPDGQIKSRSSRRTKRSAGISGKPVIFLRRTKRRTVSAKNSLGKRNKRDSQQSSDTSQDVHYFFHIEHDVASDDNSNSVANYGRRDYSVPSTRPLPPPRPPVAPPAPPPMDQPVTTPPARDQVNTGFQIVQATPILLAQPVVQQQAPAFNIPVRLSLAPKPSATVHHYYVPKKKKFKKLKKGWMWF